MVKPATNTRKSMRHSRIPSSSRSSKSTAVAISSFPTSCDPTRQRVESMIQKEILPVINRVLHWNHDAPTTPPAEAPAPIMNSSSSDCSFTDHDTDKNTVTQGSDETLEWHAVVSILRCQLVPEMQSILSPTQITTSSSRRSLPLPHSLSMLFTTLMQQELLIPCHCLRHQRQQYTLPTVTLSDTVTTTPSPTTIVPQVQPLAFVRQLKLQIIMRICLCATLGPEVLIHPWYIFQQEMRREQQQKQTHHGRRRKGTKRLAIVSTATTLKEAMAAFEQEIMSLLSWAVTMEARPDRTNDALVGFLHDCLHIALSSSDATSMTNCTLSNSLNKDTTARVSCESPRHVPYPPLGLLTNEWVDRLYELLEVPNPHHSSPPASYETDKPADWSLPPRSKRKRSPGTIDKIVSHRNTPGMVVKTVLSTLPQFSLEKPLSTIRSCGARTKSNALLKGTGTRSRFVGSHFNSVRSHTSSLLFQQVPAPPLSNKTSSATTTTKPKIHPTSMTPLPRSSISEPCPQNENHLITSQRDGLASNIFPSSVDNGNATAPSILRQRIHDNATSNVIHRAIRSVHQTNARVSFSPTKPPRLVPDIWPNRTAYPTHSRAHVVTATSSEISTDEPTPHPRQVSNTPIQINRLLSQRLIREPAIDATDTDIENVGRAAAKSLSSGTAMTTTPRKPLRPSTAQRATTVPETPVRTRSYQGGNRTDDRRHQHSLSRY